MRRLLFALPLLLSTPALAQEPRIEEVRAARVACTAMLQAAPDDWTGWRRKF